MKVILGKWSREALDRLMKASALMTHAGERIAFLSGHFIDTPYRESTLIGDSTTDEEFVIHLAGVDCFTFLEYIEAMRISSSFVRFQENLLRVRYRGGVTSFENRNHFFTDWPQYNGDLVRDITRDVGGDRVIQVVKRLNEQEDRSPLLQGIEIAARKISYLPAEALHGSVLKHLRSGDYTGVLSERAGLDVSHVGIIIAEGDAVLFRHASSREGKRAVVDEYLNQYLADKPGIIVLRPRDV